MAKHNITLLVAIVIGLLCFIITMVFSALAATGKRKFDLYRYHFAGRFCYLLCILLLHPTQYLNLCLSDPFLESTGNISDIFSTEITPSGWTFSIWTIIYIFLALVLAYVLSSIFRKYAAFFSSIFLKMQLILSSLFLNVGENVHTCVMSIFRNAYGYVYCSPAVLPHGFFVVWSLNLGLNTGWLFLWDRRCG